MSLPKAVCKHNDLGMAPRTRAACLFAVMMLGHLVTIGSAQQQATVAETQRELLQLTASDITDSAVPASTQNAISSLKRAIALQIDSIMIAMPTDVTAASVRRAISSRTPAPTVGKISDEQWRKLSEEDAKQPIAGLYGGELTLAVTKPRSSLLLIQESFNIACGTDTVLLAYTNVSGAWERILVWQSTPYDRISGAFGDTYKTLLLKSQNHNHALLLVLHGTPWCTSTMSEFKMDVLELGVPKHDALFWHGEHTYRRADLDPPLSLRPTVDGFEVRTSVNGGGDDVSRKGVMRYAVTSAGVRRVQPLAVNGRDSVVEWLGLPRKQASEFVDGTAGSLAWQMFQDFSYEGKGLDASVPYPSFGAVRACKDALTHFQVDVTSHVFDSSAKADPPGPAYFVQLRRVPNGYRIHAVTAAAASSCTGPDLMAGS